MWPSMEMENYFYFCCNFYDEGFAFFSSSCFKDGYDLIGFLNLLLITDRMAVITK